MRLSDLRGLCLVEIHDINPTPYIPNLNDEVRKCIRSLTSYIGGIPRETTLTTVANYREYGTTLDMGMNSSIKSGFPTDFLSIERIINEDDVHLTRIDFRQRIEDSTGTPQRYYLRGFRVGFDLIPDAAYTHHFFYRGLGDDVTNDSAAVIPELGLMDDDEGWDAIKYQFAENFWKSKYARAALNADATTMSIASGMKNEYHIQALKARHKFAIRMDGANKDQASQVSLPGGYFEASQEIISLDHERTIHRNS